jgi:hypothetical protein
MRRPLIALAMVIAGVLVPSASGGALDADPITVQPGETVTADYGPIPGNDPVSGQLDSESGPDPATCQLLPSCNLVPVEFVRPAGFQAEDDTYLAQITLHWDTLEVGDRNVGATSNDLDLYLWAGEWLETEEGQTCHVPDPAPEGFEPPEYCTHGLAKSASTQEPEVVRVDATTHAKFLVVVQNATGPNVGYSLEVASTYAPFTEPQEPPEADVGLPTFDDSGNVSGSTGVGSSGVTDLTPAGTLGGDDLTLAPVDAFADADLQGLEGAGLPGGESFIRRTEESGPPRPVSGTTVALWLIFVPVALGAAFGIWFMRRRPGALRISVPAPSPH